MRWLLSFAVAVGLCLASAGASAEGDEIYLRDPDPWTNTILRFTPTPMQLVCAKDEDCARPIAILEEHYHIYIARWPKGCVEPQCAVITRKVQIGPHMTLDLASLAITDRDGARLNRPRAVAHWHAELVRRGVVTISMPKPIATAKKFGLYQGEPARPSIPQVQPPARLAQTTK